MSEVLKLKEKYEEYLRGIKGVTGVGLNSSIIVYVERVTPEIRQVIPKQLEGVPVRIKETGVIRFVSVVPMTATYADRTKRFRPCPGGVSVGHPSVGTGTLTCRVRDKKTSKIIGGLTNNHVAVFDMEPICIGKKGDSILQPGVYDGGKVPDDKIGELLKWVPIKIFEPNYVDAAVFESVELRKDVLDVGTPSNTVEPIVGMKVLKSGRTSGINYGTITDVNATMGVKVNEEEIFVFKNQIVIEPGLLLPGDSGSWVGEVDTFNTVGLGFAGSDTLCVANRALTVEDLLDIEIIPPVPPVSLPIATGLWLGLFGVGFAIVYGGEKA